MKIGVIGAGTVGRATARCWLEHCDEVRLHDRIKTLETHDLISTLECDLVFVCIPEGDLEAQFQHGLPDRFRNANYIIKSTVPIGTTRRLAETYKLKNLIHSPEFLTERCSLWDAQNPAQIIIGCDSTINKQNTCEALYYDLCAARFPGVPIRVVLSEESEAVKLFVNAFASTKVSLFNEFRSLADKLGLDWHRIVEGVLGDGRIGEAWTKVPGPDGRRGFGGKCLPKDLGHLLDCFASAEMPAPSVLRAALTHARIGGKT